jgi:hypothetical protein
MPARICRNHWVLAHVHHLRSRITIFDSNRAGTPLEEKLRVVKTINSILRAERQSRQLAHSDYSFHSFADTNLPQQKDGSSCGAFVCAYGHILATLNRAPTLVDFPGQESSLFIRLAIADRLISLLPPPLAQSFPQTSSTAAAAMAMIGPEFSSSTSSSSSSSSSSTQSASAMDGRFLSANLGVKGLRVNCIQNLPQTQLHLPLNTMYQSTSLSNDALQCDLIGNGDHARLQFLVFIFFLTRAVFAVPARAHLGFSLILHQYSNKSHPLPFVKIDPHVTRVAHPSDLRNISLGSQRELEIQNWVNEMTSEGTLLNIIPDVTAVVPCSQIRLSINPAVSSVSHDSEGRLLYESLRLPDDIGGLRA